MGITSRTSTWGVLRKPGKYLAVGEYFVDSVNHGQVHAIRGFHCSHVLGRRTATNSHANHRPDRHAHCHTNHHPSPAPASLPNLVLEWFDVCVEGMGCWPKSDDEAGVSGSRRVSITWIVANNGNTPTESPTDLRLYADGQHHEGEYLMGRDAFVIPILEPGDAMGVRDMTKKNPDDFWPITFSLVGQNAIIAIVDIEDRVEESNECGNLKRYRDIFSAMQSDCDNVAYVSDLVFLPTPVPTPTPAQ